MNGTLGAVFDFFSTTSFEAAVSSSPSLLVSTLSTPMSSDLPFLLAPPFFEAGFFFFPKSSTSAAWSTSSSPPTSGTSLALVFFLAAAFFLVAPWTCSTSFPSGASLAWVFFLAAAFVFFGATSSGTLDSEATGPALRFVARFGGWSSTSAFAVKVS